MAGYDKLIPVSRPSLGKEELAAVKEVFDSGWLGLGKWVFEFENKIKDYLGAQNAIAVNTGTTALHLALDSIGIKAKDEVIVPSLTFAASIQAILACGGRPVFCDICADTLNMDMRDLEKKLSPRTKAVMPVHYGGQPCPMDEVLDIARSRKIRVVEDAAHAFGSDYKSRKIGSFGDVTCFSFDPIKVITCGEGGAIVTNDNELAEIAYKKRILGIDKDTWSRYKHKRDWFYSVTTQGYRYHLSNINAAIGLVQLKKIRDFIARRRRLCLLYDNQLGKISGLEPLKRDYRRISPFNYVVKVPEKRDELMAYLKSNGIDSGVHYIPNHLQPFFKPFASSLAVTEKVWQQMITLPLYADLSEKKVMQISKAVKEFFS